MTLDCTVNHGRKSNSFTMFLYSKCTCASYRKVIGQSISSFGAFQYALALYISSSCVLFKIAIEMQLPGTRALLTFLEAARLVCLLDRLLESTNFPTSHAWSGVSILKWAPRIFTALLLFLDFTVTKKQLFNRYFIVEPEVVGRIHFFRSRIIHVDRGQLEKIQKVVLSQVKVLL